MTFDEMFKLLTGHDPFPWQVDLYNNWFAKGKFPTTCNLPTGLGKTNLIAIWLIALANGVRISRRLVYVVNRRTVVDQTTNEALKLRDSAFKIGVDNLVISTLRGQFADNQEWSVDPSRPAIICGTVDMIGSRLLFSGYRIGFRSRPLHAGFLGQDALLVHDESHLEPAFQHLIDKIVHEQNQTENTKGLPWPKLRIMALSATIRHDNQHAQMQTYPSFELTEQERQLPTEIPDVPTEPIHHVWRRLNAKKSLYLHRVARNKIAEEIARLALKFKEANAAVLVFVRSIDDVRKVCEKLTHKKNGVSPDRVQRLTGTMRGKERDDLAHRDPVFMRFLPKKNRNPEINMATETVYLVCTSAGEVGVDISGDNLVCDLTTFECMSQRLGRVNRYGEPNEHTACIDVVYPQEFDEKSKLSPMLDTTLRMLQQLPRFGAGEEETNIVHYDASPRALSELNKRSDLLCKIEDAFTPKPTILDATDILFDAWALTSIRKAMPGRPPLEPYLHGLADWEPPETHVAWREEVDQLSGDLLSRYHPEDLLEDYPLRPHELLRDRSDRVFAQLQSLATRKPDAPVWLLDVKGSVTRCLLADLADPSITQSAAKKPLIQRIAHDTVLLPPNAGGLNQGMLDSTSDYAEDIADVDTEIEGRIRLFSNDDQYSKKSHDMRLVRSIELSVDDDDEQLTWDWYRRKPLEGTRTAQRPVLWDIHVQDVEHRVDSILSNLGFSKKHKDIAQAIRTAARLHDQGKHREQFQLALGNRAYPECVWAKSGRQGARLPETYRHEFGSLTDTVKDMEFQQLSSQMQDLVLHLIAAHHGRARPHFDLDEAFDPKHPSNETEEILNEIPRRFARLQRCYGRWGLAYLESLIRAADWAASAEPSTYIDKREDTI